MAEGGGGAAAGGGGNGHRAAGEAGAGADAPEQSAAYFALYRVSGKYFSEKGFFCFPPILIREIFSPCEKIFPCVFLLKSFQNTVFSEQILGIPLENLFHWKKVFLLPFQ